MRFDFYRVASRRCSTLASLVSAPTHLEVVSIASRGRGVRSTRALEQGATVLTAAPLGHVVTAFPSSTVQSAADLCGVCARPRSGARGGMAQCESPCVRVTEPDGIRAATAKLMLRCDWNELEVKRVEENRKFPLLIGALLARTLVELHRNGGGSSDAASPTMGLLQQLCFSTLPPELDELLTAEHAAVISVFADAGVVSASSDLEGIFPRELYVRLLGALQLNTFQVVEAGGSTRSAVLGGPASFFNHSCDPSLLMTANPGTGDTKFVAAIALPAETELCISYIDVDQPGPARRAALDEKYGFQCNCARCEAGD